MTTPVSAGLGSATAFTCGVSPNFSKTTAFMVVAPSNQGTGFRRILRGNCESGHYKAPILSANFARITCGLAIMTRNALLRLALGALVSLNMMAGAIAGDGPAKQMFGAQTLPALGAPQSDGYYAKGCLAGGVALPEDGPTWQVMRLSRNRRWGHPHMIGLLEKLSRDAYAKAGWNGLLVGDISQPRGGPMLTGHASHQVGLDADIWLTPMPKRRFTAEQRETVA